MSVLWDAPMVAVLARELASRLEGARLNAMRMDPDNRDLVLHFRERTLVFRLHPLHGDIAILPARDPGPDAKALKSTLREVQSLPDDRILMLQLQPSGGSPSPVGIVVELMTNQWNAIRLDVATRRIERVLWKRETAERTLAPGRSYDFPPPSDRAGIDEPLDEGEWADLLAEAAPDERRGVLLRGVAFTSSLNAPWILGGEAAARRRWLRIRSVALGLAEADPHVHRSPKRTFPYPLRLGHLESRPVDSFFDGLGMALEEDRKSAAEDGGGGGGSGEPRASAAAALVPSALLDRLERAIADAEGKAARLREELAGTEEPDDVRARGDLILARFAEVPRGEERVTLEGFDGEPVEVELDPSLSPQENAKAYYREAARIERARERLPELIEEADREAAELRRLGDAASSGAVDPERIREILPASRKKRQGSGAEEEPSLPYRSYRSAGGLEIRVGRGAKANDELTFHHSSPDDIWLHARQAAGAHVILRWQESGSPPARDLAQAACLAALHSQARHSSSVPVDWTRRKYVRSPRKAPPGSVIPQQVKTVFVDPDPELEKELRDG